MDEIRDNKLSESYAVKRIGVEVLKDNTIRRSRQIKRFGGSFGIHLTQQDMRDFNVKEGDWVVIDDVFKEVVSKEEMEEHR